MKELDESELWALRDSDPEARDELVRRNMGLARKIANSFFATVPPSAGNACSDYSDIEADAFQGLVDAVDRFDHSRGWKFATYAPLRIRGAIKDAQRELDWLPRSVREMRRAAQFLIEHGLSELEVCDILQKKRFRVAQSLADITLGGSDILFTTTRDIEQKESFGPVFQADLADLLPAPNTHDAAKLALHELLLLLDPDSRSVVVALYFEGRSQTELAAERGITASRISQIHTAALRRMRAAANPFDFADFLSDT
jgi:RNA polymerase sigma factor FliA